MRAANLIHTWNKNIFYFKKNKDTDTAKTTLHRSKTATFKTYANHYYNRENNLSLSNNTFSNQQQQQSPSSSYYNSSSLASHATNNNNNGAFPNFTPYSNNNNIDENKVQISLNKFDELLNKSLASVSSNTFKTHNSYAIHLLDWSNRDGTSSEDVSTIFTNDNNNINASSIGTTMFFDKCEKNYFRSDISSNDK